MLCRTGENNFHPSGCLVLPPNENLFWKTIIYKNGSHSCMCTYRHSTWLKETTRIKLQIILQVFSILLIKNRAMPLFKMFTCCRLLFPYGYDSAPWKRSLHPVTLPCRDWLNRHVCILHVVSNQREGTELPILRSLREYAASFMTLSTSFLCSGEANTGRWAGLGALPLSASHRQTQLLEVKPPVKRDIQSSYWHMQVNLQSGVFQRPSGCCR